MEDRFRTTSYHHGYSSHNVVKEGRGFGYSISYCPINILRTLCSTDIKLDTYYPLPKKSRRTLSVLMTQGLRSRSNYP